MFRKENFCEGAESRRSRGWLQVKKEADFAASSPVIGQLFATLVKNSLLFFA